MDNNYMIPVYYDRYMETEKWKRQIPFIKFSPKWEVQITPPFAGATVRFRVRKGNAHVSVYLDCYDRLGSCGQPYWEVYPYKGDVFRCLMDETDLLLTAIEKSLDAQNITL